MSIEPKVLIYALEGGLMYTFVKPIRERAQKGISLL
jgi:hypothetical protein